MRKSSISRYNYFNIIVVIFISIFAIGYSWINFEKEKLEDAGRIIRDNYLKERKNNIKRQIDHVIDDFGREIKFSRDKIKICTKNRVYEAYSILDNLYNSSKDKISEEKLKFLCKEALRNIRYNDGKGYYFIASLEGESILSPIWPEMEGEDISGLKDVNGTEIIKNEIYVASSSDDGGFVEDYWIKPGANKKVLKISFVKKFKPFNWYIGTGEYLDDAYVKLQKNFLEKIRFLNEKNSNFIFVLKKDGVVVEHKTEELINLSIEKINKDEVNKLLNAFKTAAESGSFVDYSEFLDPSLGKVSNKITYFREIKEFDWIIGSGLFMNEVNKEILKQTVSIKKDISDNTKKIILILITILIIGVVLAHVITDKTRKNFKLLMRFFEKGSNANVDISVENYDFAEFTELAESAYKMIKSRNKALNNLEKNKKDLEEIVKKRTFELKNINDKLENEIKNQKRIETLIRESEERFKALADASYETILMHKDGIIIDVNRNVEKMFGFRPEEVIGKSPLDFTVSSFREIVNNKINDYDDTPYEAEVYNADGDVINVEIRGNILEYNGEKVKVVSIRDITEQKRTEEYLIQAKEKAEKADRLKTEFLANMSHEIRTPMTSILGFAGLLSKTDISVQQTRFVNTIISSSNHLLVLINDIIDLAKIESDELEISMSPCDINNIFYDVKKIFEPQLKDNNEVVFDINMPEQNEIVLYTDPVRLKQIIINILSNAFKFTSDGKVSLDYSQNEEKVFLKIDDTGMGIPEDKKDFIFKKFTQVDSSYTRKYGGVGLGLAISKKLCDLLNINIVVESRLGVGSTFTLEIIKSDYNNKDNNENPDKYKENSQLDNIGKIMVVDDVVENVDLLKEILEFSDFEVLSAYNGKDALKIYKEEENISVIFLDLQMPVMDGFAALRKIREIQKDEGRKEIIIAITAHATSEDRALCLKKGFDDYVSKPFEMDKIVNVIVENLK